jgi:hypothetical protein
VVHAAGSLLRPFSGESVGLEDLSLVKSGDKGESDAIVASAANPVSATLRCPLSPLGIGEPSVRSQFTWPTCQVRSNALLRLQQPLSKVPQCRRASPCRPDPASSAQLVHQVSRYSFSFIFVISNVPDHTAPRAPFLSGPGVLYIGHHNTLNQKRHSGALFDPHFAAVVERITHLFAFFPLSLQVSSRAVPFPRFMWAPHGEFSERCPLLVFCHRLPNARR